MIFGGSGAVGETLQGFELETLSTMKGAFALGRSEPSLSFVFSFMSLLIALASEFR